MPALLVSATGSPRAAWRDARWSSAAIHRPRQQARNPRQGAAVRKPPLAFRRDLRRAESGGSRDPAKVETCCPLEAAPSAPARCGRHFAPARHGSSECTAAFTGLIFDTEFSHLFSPARVNHFSPSSVSTAWLWCVTRSDERRLRDGGNLVAAGACSAQRSALQRGRYRRRPVSGHDHDALEHARDCGSRQGAS